MSFWKITDAGPQKVAETKLKNESILEQHLEDWIIRSPEMLGEQLYVIGRQVFVPEVKDRVDILALDAEGNTVIIEIKRGKLQNPVDMQALRYASYISKWEFGAFEDLAKGFNVEKEEYNFNEAYEEFCQENGTGEVPDINHDQRIIIVGAEVRDKLGSVALWLFDHQIKIKVVEISFYKEKDTILLNPKTIIPQPVNKFSDVGKVIKRSDLSRPWLNTGKDWHMEKRMNGKAREMFLQLDYLIKNNFEVEGPFYDQKFYVSYKLSGLIWLTVHTKANSLLIMCDVNKRVFNTASIAKQLGIKEFDMGDTLSDKLNLGSSALVEDRNNRCDRIKLRLKDNFDIGNPELLKLLKEMFKNSAKIPAVAG